MEEADVLGDRIAMMASGKIKVCIYIYTIYVCTNAAADFNLNLFFNI